MSNRWELLKARILRIGLRQDRLAALTGLDESTLSRAFNGHTNPLTSTLDKIEAAIAAEEARMVKDLSSATPAGAA